MTKEHFDTTAFKKSDEVKYNGVEYPILTIDLERRTFGVNIGGAIEELTHCAIEFKPSGATRGSIEAQLMQKESLLRLTDVNIGKNFNALSDQQKRSLSEMKIKTLAEIDILKAIQIEL